MKEYHLMKQVTFNDIHFGGYYYDSTNYNFALFDTQYSKWKRVDEGGGKIKGKQGDEFKKFVKDVETKNVEIWNKESEYKYGSWQDNTKIFLESGKYTIVDVKFGFELKFNSSVKIGKQKVINELCKEGKSHDTDVYYEEEYSCHDMEYKIRCYYNKEEYNRMKAFHKKIWFPIGLIFFILGY